MKHFSGLRPKRTPQGEKIYQGTYNYFRGDNLYSEEDFIIYRDNNGLSFSFFSFMNCRVATGEILQIYVDYVISKDYTPQKVLIEKSLGNYQTSEIYQYDGVKSSINYFFLSTGKKREYFEIPITSKMHITTPTTVTSMLFLRVAKDSMMGKNFYSLFTSYNQWDFKAPPEVKKIVLQRPNVGTFNLRIGEEIISVPVYNLYENVNEGSISSSSPFLEIYMSKHLNIPYMIKAKEDVYVQMKKIEYLNKD